MGKSMPAVRGNWTSRRLGIISRGREAFACARCGSLLLRWWEKFRGNSDCCRFIWYWTCCGLIRWESGNHTWTCKKWNAAQPIDFKVLRYNHRHIDRSSVQGKYLKPMKKLTDSHMNIIFSLIRKMWWNGGDPLATEKWEYRMLHGLLHRDR